MLNKDQHATNTKRRQFLRQAGTGVLMAGILSPLFSPTSRQHQTTLDNSEH